ncbi:MAG: hypothetical protein ACYTDY_13770, partial [Planctomycetota bacterium]
MVAMSGMTVYFIRRLMLVPVTFFVITFMVYAILRVVPGGPIEQAEARMRMAQMSEGGGGSAAIGEEQDLQINEAAMRDLESYYALDRSIPVGYLQWLGLWPRERRRRIPFVSETGNEAAIQRLRGLSGEELRAAEEETGIYLDPNGRPVRLAFRPLGDLHGIRTKAAEDLAKHLKQRKLVEFQGDLYRPVMEGEEAARKDFFAKAQKLVLGGFGKRDELLEYLGEEGFTWQKGGYYVRLAEAKTDED